jgi:hypothetical protein
VRSSGIDLQRMAQPPSGHLPDFDRAITAAGADQRASVLRERDPANRITMPAERPEQLAAASVPQQDVAAMSGFTDVDDTSSTSNRFAVGRKGERANGGRKGDPAKDDAFGFFESSSRSDQCLVRDCNRMGCDAEHEQGQTDTFEQMHDHPPNSAFANGGCFTLVILNVHIELR